MSTLSVSAAARLLEAGELAAFPTETVYGLGADAENPAAIARLYALKGRPLNHPVIVHVLPDADLSAWVGALPQFAHDLIAAFWPGPLTLVLPKREGVADACSGGQATLALRAPSHPTALELLHAFKGGKGGLAAPSANRFGHVSPTLAAHVAAEFAELAVIDGGACSVGIESTIVDCTLSAPRVLRPGMISAAQIEVICGTLLEGFAPKPRVSGDLASHYAPRAKLRLMDRLPERVPPRTASLSRAEQGGVPHIRASDNAADYARALYANLRALDAAQPAEIWVERPPPGLAWAGVHDRLRRAAAAA